MLICPSQAPADMTFNAGSLNIRTGDAARLESKANGSETLKWESSAPKIAQVFQNGFVIGLEPGQVGVVARDNAGNQVVECLVTVESAQQWLVDPASLRQYPDSRRFNMGERLCFGSELNGQRAIDPNEKEFTRANRVINPKPLREGKELYWELKPGSEIFDGAGVLMGTVPPTMTVDGRHVPVSMFNFGASKVMGGRIFVYAFSVSIVPSAAVTALLQPGALKQGRVETSAWLPLDDVVEKEVLLQRIGLGKARLPALPLEPTGRRVTGGNIKQYVTERGELTIVQHIARDQVGAPPVPSHYLRRPSGTVNLVYSVPGFGLGGQGTDSFLVSDGVEFYPARGAKVFTQPTYYPPKDPHAGKVSPQTMTFLYGAIKVSGCDPVYGWIAKEALAP